MKSRGFTVPFLAAALALSPLCHAADADLMKEAKVSEAQARRTALAKVPRGTVKSHELEEENGLLVWTYDIAQRGMPGVTEVHVDARTGRVVMIKKESAAEEAREKEAEKRPVR